MNIVVIGCGRFGVHLIHALSKRANPPYITAVDQNEKAFDKLPPEMLGFTVIRDASDLTVLDEVKAGRADLIVLATNDPDLNFMLAHASKELYKTPRVIVAESEAENKGILDSFEIDSINPLEFAAQEITARIDSEWGAKS